MFDSHNDIQIRQSWHKHMHTHTKIEVLEQAIGEVDKPYRHVCDVVRDQVEESFSVLPTVS